ncbi:unnamed protein product, partial [Mesorhabditis belari]|uniref:DNA helicase Pif1-like 2B domain-containing protein n=1 Tax=Mesorhabditis belari TaxID=2138241 RepID=A0AAF3EYX9_9BILA
MTPTGLPPHVLNLKVGCMVVLLRDIDIRHGLCNGTRLIVIQLGRRVLVGEFATDYRKGFSVLIPKIDLIHSHKTKPFKLRRRQFPMRLSYCMTINKSQGQSFERVGIAFLEPTFSHGQLYVALCSKPTRNSHQSNKPTNAQHCLQRSVRINEGEQAANPMPQPLCHGVQLMNLVHQSSQQPARAFIGGSGNGFEMANRMKGPMIVLNPCAQSHPFDEREKYRDEKIAQLHSQLESAELSTDRAWKSFLSEDRLLARITVLEGELALKGFIFLVRDLDQQQHDGELDFDCNEELLASKEMVEELARLKEENTMPQATLINCQSEIAALRVEAATREFGLDEPIDPAVSTALDENDENSVFFLKPCQLLNHFLACQ